MSGVSTYTVMTMTSRVDATTLLVPDVPPAGSGLYVVVRPDCPGGQWTSGGASECLFGCPPGQRQGNLP